MHRKIISRKNIKKIFGVSKAISVFESLLLCIWQFECSVYIFRGPWLIVLSIKHPAKSDVATKQENLFIRDSNPTVANV